MFEFWFVFVVFALFCFYVFLQCKLKTQQRRICGYESITGIILLAQPDDNGIYNISSRVQGQQSQYPDAYLSVDHITISNELNKPPKHDDAPPSYEQAMKLAMAHSNSIQTFQAEQVNNTRPQAHSSTSSSTTTVVVPTVASQSTE